MVFVKYKPAGLQDIAHWVNRGRWVEFAPKQAEEEESSYYYLHNISVSITLDLPRRLVKSSEHLCNELCTRSHDIEGIVTCLIG